MGLQTCVATTDADLTTTSQVKTMLGTTLTSDDAHLSTLIRRASRWAEAYVGYPLSAQSYLETLPSHGTRRLTLARTPVRAVTGLFRGTDSADYTQVDSSDFAVNAEAGFLERAAGWEWTAPVEGDLVLHPLVGQEIPDWRAEYAAGYTYAGIDTGSSLYSTVKGTTSTGRTLPEDIEAAVVAKTIGWYQGDENVVARSVGDLRIQYGTFGGGEAADPARALLGPYRRF